MVEAIVHKDIREIRQSSVKAKQKNRSKFSEKNCYYNNIIIIILARTPDIGQGLEGIRSCAARKTEQT